MDEALPVACTRIRPHPNAHGLAHASATIVFVTHNEFFIAYDVQTGDIRYSIRGRVMTSFGETIFVAIPNGLEVRRVRDGSLVSPPTPSDNCFGLACTSTRLFATHCDCIQSFSFDGYALHPVGVIGEELNAVHLAAVGDELFAEDSKTNTTNVFAQKDGTWLRTFCGGFHCLSDLGILQPGCHRCAVLDLEGRRRQTWDLGLCCVALRAGLDEVFLLTHTKLYSFPLAKKSALTK
jgi:hypothetical protein